MNLDLPLSAAALGVIGLALGPGLALLAHRFPADGREGPDTFPARYPVAAGAAAVLGAAAGVLENSPAGALVTAILGWHLLLIALVDGEHYWLPDRLTLPLLAGGSAAAIVLDGVTVVDAAIGALAGFALLWLLARVYRRVRGREGLGGGDPILLAAVGAWTGWMRLASVLLWAALAGLSLTAGRAVAGHRVSGADRLPFGVFLALGGWLTWVLGPLGL